MEILFRRLFVPAYNDPLGRGSKRALEGQGARTQASTLAVWLMLPLLNTGLESCNCFNFLAGLIMTSGNGLHCVLRKKLAGHITARTLCCITLLTYYALVFLRARYLPFTSPSENDVTFSHI